MAMNPKDIDPAIVATGSVPTKPEKKEQPPQPKKPEIPVTSRIVADADVDSPLGVNWKTHCAVSTADGKVVSVPRTVATKLPVVAPVLADQAADDTTPIQVGTTASAVIALAHWVEHTGSAAAKSESAMPEKVLYTEMNNVVATEWEKDFHDRLLTSDGDTLFRVTNFAEQNGMIGLLDFCVVAISTSIRGKSNHEMMVALNVSGEEMTEDDIAAGKAAYPWYADVTRVQQQ